MALTKAQSQTVVKKVQGEAAKLQPSALLTFFEIDLTDILFERGQISSIDSLNIQEEQIKVFRFHNNINLINSNIVFQGKTYYALPIMVEGLEVSGSGTLPTPTLTLSTIEEGSAALSLLKCQIASLSDMVGAKVTIKRTFLKHIDAINFAGRKLPDDYDEDPICEFTKEIYYVDRKIEESKLVLKYELNSILDLRNVKLPRRLIFANRCPFNFRGAGCCYEFSDSKVSGPSRLSELHDGVNEKYLGRNGYAPPVMNEAGTLFKDVYGINYQDLSDVELTDYDKGEYDKDSEYTQAQYVFITKDNINYYFVAKKAVPPNTPPPNRFFWESAQCTKSIKACQLHFGNRELPFGGFAGVEKLSSR